MICVSILPEKWYSSVHELLRAAFVEQPIVFTPQAEADIQLAIRVETMSETVIFSGQLQAQSQPEQTYRQEMVLSLDMPERDKEISRLLRIFIFEWMTAYLGAAFSEYGILSGVRPLKLVHRCMDAGWNREKILHHMQEHYRVSPQKSQFLYEVAQNNHFLLNSRAEAKKKLGIYIGIPYCPTRCYYCSFPGAILRSYEKDIPPFLSALYRELTAIGEFLASSSFSIQNLYIGGGTPTVLNETDLHHLLEVIRQKLNLADCQEFTVEAGRPDTLNPVKLRCLRDFGVQRICVNPQTMNDATLARIGRRHTAADIERAIAMARDIGIENINMDLIVGLSGEGAAEYRYTMQKILELHPENVTVHSLAVKKGSTLAEKEGLGKVAGQAALIEKTMQWMAGVLAEQGYFPYYMYRQKYMKANMENTGYSLPGKQCLYNVQMMEERQTIIGLGGGSSSKFVRPEDWTLTSFHNPKDPKSYWENVERCIQVKLDNLRTIS